MEHKQFCRICGRRHLPHELSHRGLCAACGKAKLLSSIKQLQDKQGPVWDKWVRNYIASMQATIFKLRKESQEND